MKKIIVGVAIVIVAAIGFGVAFKLTPTKSATPATVSSTITDVTQVNLTATGASPDQVNVIVGKSIQFNSKDGKSHNLGLSDDSQHNHSTESDTAYKSGVFKADEAWKASFKTAGTYTFTDSLNPKISILVVAYVPSK